MELETLKDLYVHELKDLYSAENQLIKALPRIAKAATNRQLSAAFNQHLEQTKRQEEGATDKKLTKLARSVINPRAKKAVKKTEKKKGMTGAIKGLVKTVMG